MHKPLRSREDILDFAARHAPSNACARAIFENRVAVERTPYDMALDFIGWRLRVESKYGRRWLLLVKGDDKTRRYTVLDVTSPTPEPETSTGLRGHADGETPVHDRRVQVDQDRTESRQVEDNSTDENGD